VRELTEQFPERKNAAISAGREERSRARGALRDLVLSLHQTHDALRIGHFDGSCNSLEPFSHAAVCAVPLLEAASAVVFVQPTDS